MSIIILAQSLKNDGTADIQIDSEFAPSSEKLRLLDEFDRNGRVIKFKKYGEDGIKFGEAPDFFRLDKISAFIVNCEEKDNIGRNSPIVIQAKLTELENVIQHLKMFLKKSGRTISTSKEELLRNKINSVRNATETKARIYVLKNPLSATVVLLVATIIVITILTNLFTKGDF
jgi:hypothetical protein